MERGLGTHLDPTATDCDILCLTYFLVYSISGAANEMACVMRCGTPDCDWGWPMADLAPWPVEKCYSAFRDHCIETHGLDESDRGRHAFGPAALDFDADSFVLTIGSFACTTSRAAVFPKNL